MMSKPSATLRVANILLNIAIFIEKIAGWIRHEAADRARRDFARHTLTDDMSVNDISKHLRDIAYKYEKR